jgi:putative ABC transport system permease protein
VSGAIAGLAARSLWNRRSTGLLTVIAIAVSVTLLLGVQKMRDAARESFANTLSGTDLIVGARSGPVNLLLYSVFRVGDATASVSWPTYLRVARHRDVAWTIPLSLGDSHRGYRVLGTTPAYFQHYGYARTRRLAFAHGGAFAQLHDAVLGAEVARTLQYRIGDALVIGHGLGEVSFSEHDDQPFRVVGILAPTGTPVDRTVHVSLEAVSAIHDARDPTPTAITAFLVGMKSKDNVLQMQRALNEYPAEALLAIIPGTALQQLWSIVGIADRALMVVAAFVVLAGLLGMLTAILTSLNERRREMAILRSVGAHPLHVFALLLSEAGLLALAGVAVGVALAYALLAAAQPWLVARYGLFVAIGGLSGYDLSLLAAVVVAAVLMGLIPAWRAYRNSLADGLSIRV